MTESRGRNYDINYVTHDPAGLVVVEVDPGLEGVAGLQAVEELLGHLRPEVEVVAAPAPLPVQAWNQVELAHLVLGKLGGKFVRTNVHKAGS